MHGDTRYNYKQGIGEIHEKYHYIHFSLNLTNLKDTYLEILYSYHNLSLKGELGNSGLLLNQASILYKEIHQVLQL